MTSIDLLPITWLLDQQLHPREEAVLLTSISQGELLPTETLSPPVRGAISIDAEERQFVMSNFLELVVDIAKVQAGLGERQYGMPRPRQPERDATLIYVLDLTARLLKLGDDQSQECQMQLLVLAPPSLLIRILFALAGHAPVAAAYLVRVVSKISAYVEEVYRQSVPDSYVFMPSTRSHERDLIVRAIKDRWIVEQSRGQGEMSGSGEGRSHTVFLQGDNILYPLRNPTSFEPEAIEATRPVRNSTQIDLAYCAAYHRTSSVPAFEGMDIKFVLDSQQAVAILRNGDTGHDGDPGHLLARWSVSDCSGHVIGDTTTGDETTGSFCSFYVGYYAFILVAASCPRGIWQDMIIPPSRGIMFYKPVLLTCPEWTYDLDDEDLKRVAGIDNRLTTSIIDAWACLIQQSQEGVGACLPVEFMKMALRDHRQGSDTWTLGWSCRIPRDEVLTWVDRYDRWIMPAFREVGTGKLGHWYLIVWYIGRNSIFVYDSLGPSGDHSTAVQAVSYKLACLFDLVVPGVPQYDDIQVYQYDDIQANI